MMVVVQALTARHQGKPLIVEGRVRIALGPEAVPDCVDRGVEREVAHRVDGGGEETHAPAQHEAERRDADAEPDEGMVEEQLVPSVRRQVLRIPLGRVPVTRTLR